MKKLIFLSLFIPALAKAQFVIVNTSTVSLMEPRTGKWPMDLQRVIRESDTCYVLNFRDQQESAEVTMSTLKFGDLTQLRFFQKGLSALKTGNTGDIAKFKEYTIKRMDVKKIGEKGTIWFTLTCNDGSVTNFQQAEADRMITAIKGL
ncbi:MAG TPA: hypothetical protein VNU70_10165 [Puia sp.]|jgi:hypothetical protein|nr:hypothetical protein [Puia sp.]